jgi:hypothetical protein
VKVLSTVLGPWNEETSTVRVLVAAANCGSRATEVRPPELALGAAPAERSFGQQPQKRSTRDDARRSINPSFALADVAIELAGQDLSLSPLSGQQQGLHLNFDRLRESSERFSERLKLAINAIHQLEWIGLSCKHRRSPCLGPLHSPSPPPKPSANRI